MNEIFGKNCENRPLRSDDKKCMEFLSHEFSCSFLFPFFEADAAAAAAARAAVSLCLSLSLCHADGIQAAAAAGRATSSSEVRSPHPNALSFSPMAPKGRIGERKVEGR